MIASLAFKVLALLITVGLMFLFRRKFQDFSSTRTSVEYFLITGLLILLVGITFYYS